MANVPWYYLPKFILINAPLAVLAGLLLVVLTVFKWKKLFRSPLLIGFVVFAMVFPIVYAEYQSMYYYNGWRHYLFVYPPLIILSALGWEGLMKLLGKSMAVLSITAVLIGLCALPAWWMFNNHPNECVYFNELTGGIKGAYGNYETDYYSNSCRAAGEWLAKNEPGKKLVVAINNEPQTAAYYAAKINPNLEFRWVREYEEQKPFWDYAILTSRTFTKKELQGGSFPPKGTVHVIEADGVPLAAIVKREDYNMPLGYQAMNAKLMDSAIYYFERATQYNPKDEETWRMLGNSYMNKGSADSAILYLRQAIEVSPENYTAYNDLGLVYMNLKKDNANAINCFEKATELKFNFAEGYYYEASCYMMQQDFNHAIALYEKAIKRGGSGIPELYYNLGICYLNTGLNKKAEDNFINCLSLNSNFAQGYRALAEAFNKQGKTNEAQQCMQRYQQLGGK
jgi:tetratricopeptide (TPR) repeat protein